MSATILMFAVAIFILGLQVGYQYGRDRVEPALWEMRDEAIGLARELSR